MVSTKGSKKIKRYQKRLAQQHLFTMRLSNNTAMQLKQKLIALGNEFVQDYLKESKVRKETVVFHAPNDIAAKNTFQGQVYSSHETPSTDNDPRDWMMITGYAVDKHREADFTSVFEAFQKKEIFKITQKMLENEFKTDRTHVALERYAQRISYDVRLSQMEDTDFSQTIEVRASSLIKELSSKEIGWTAKAFVTGISSHAKSILIEDRKEKIIIRNSNQEDLTTKIPVYAIFSTPIRHDSTDGIFEFSIESDNQQAIYGTMERLIKVLRLYRASVVNYQSFRIETESIIDYQGRGTNYYTSRFNFSPKINLDEKDSIPLNKLYERLRDILNDDYLIHGQPTKPWHIALSMYEKSINESRLEEEKLMFTVIGLEALFLFRDDAKKGQKISHRTAKFLEKLDEDYDTVRKNVSIAYDHRSDYTHGSTFTGDRAELLNLNETLWKYLRKSILMWMILEDIGYNKEQIANWISEEGKKSDNEGITKTFSNEKAYLIECFT